MAGRIHRVWEKPYIPKTATSHSGGLPGRAGVARHGDAGGAGTKPNLSAAAVAVLFLAGGLAGCLDASDEACTGSECDPQPSNGGAGSNGQTPTGPSDIANATFPQIRWEECTGVIGLFEVLREDATRVIPAAFQPIGFTARTATVEFKAVQCKRVTTTNEIFQDQAFLRIAAGVVPVNESWPRGDASRYALDLVTTLPALSDAAAVLGALALAAELSRTSIETPAGSVLEQWKFQGDDFSVEFEYADSGQTRPLPSFDPVYWYENPGHFRAIQGMEVYTLDGALIEEGGLFRASGDLNVSPILRQSCCLEWGGTSIPQFSDTWQGNSTVYRT